MVHLVSEGNLESQKLYTCQQHLEVFFFVFCVFFFVIQGPSICTSVISTCRVVGQKESNTWCFSFFRTMYPFSSVLILCNGLKEFLLSEIPASSKTPFIWAVVALYRPNVASPAPIRCCCLHAAGHFEVECFKILLAGKHFLDQSLL